MKSCGSGRPRPEPYVRTDLYTLQGSQVGGGVISTVVVTESAVSVSSRSSSAATLSGGSAICSTCLSSACIGVSPPLSASIGLNGEGGGRSSVRCVLGGGESALSM